MRAQHTMEYSRASTIQSLRQHIGRTLIGALIACAAFSSPAKAWWNDDWSLRKKITIDTGASGVAITDQVGAPPPVLVRLHAGNFRFASAKEDGSDLRFVASDDKTPLKYQIEKYNSLLNEALVWVNVPDIRSGSRAEFWLYYDNHKAASGSDAKGVFDGDTVLDYHFSESGLPPQDSSIWANHALSPGRVADGALIGQGLRLDGSAPVVVPDTPSLALPENSAMTWSAWINMAAPLPGSILFSRRENGSGFAVGLDDGVPFVEVNSPSQTLRTPPAAPVAPGQWHHLAVITDGTNIALYLDGNAYATVAGSLPGARRQIFDRCRQCVCARRACSGATGPHRRFAGTGRYVASARRPVRWLPRPPLRRPPLDGSQAAGAAAPPLASPVAAAASGFVGDIDELVIAKTARPAGYLKFIALDQGSDPGKLVTYSEDEETSSWLTGYFAVILKSVTLDGWVIIGLLGIMAVLSWVVMIDKIGYLGKQAKGNTRFLEKFREEDSEFASLEPIAPASEAGKAKSEARRDPMRDSSLLRLSDRCVAEIRRRFAKSTGEHVLSGQAITRHPRGARHRLHQGNPTAQSTDGGFDHRHLGRPVSRPLGHRGGGDDHLRGHRRVGRRQRQRHRAGHRRGAGGDGGRPRGRDPCAVWLQLPHRPHPGPDQRYAGLHR